MRDQQLKVEVNEGLLSISIGVDILSWACEMGRRDGHDIVVTNKDIFAEGVAQQLKSEEEDGTTLVHKMFDDAVSVMIEKGEHGVDLEDE